MTDRAPESISGLPAKPSLLPYLFHLRSAAGPVLILAPGRTYQLRLPGAIARIAEVTLGCLDGRLTIPELIASVQAQMPEAEPEMVVGLLQYLAKQKLLMDAASAPPDALSPDELARRGRNLSFFAAFEDAGRTRYDYQLALRQATVGLIGLGGVGSWLAYSLAMVGVGRIVGVDGDRVEVSNLNRQILYRPQDVGKCKTEVAAEALAAVSPGIEFTGLSRWMRSEQDVADAIRGCDLVLLSADAPMGLITRWANAACFALRIPLLVAGMASRFVTVGPLFVPGLTGCWQCVDTYRRHQSRQYGEMFQLLAEQRASIPPSLAPLCAVTGGRAAHEAVEYLTGIARPATLGCELVTDMVTMQVKRRAVERQADCPVCRVPAEEMPCHAAQLPKPQSRGPLSWLTNVLRG